MTSIPPDIADMLTALGLDLRRHEDGTPYAEDTHNGFVRIYDRWPRKERGVFTCSARGPSGTFATFADAVRAYHAHVFPVVPSPTSEFTADHVGGTAVARITAALGLDLNASVDEVVARIGETESALDAINDLLTERGSTSDDLPTIDRVRAVLDQRDIGTSLRVALLDATKVDIDADGHRVPMTDAGMVGCMSDGYVTYGATMRMWEALGEPDGMWPAERLMERATCDLNESALNLGALRGALSMTDPRIPEARVLEAATARITSTPPVHSAGVQEAIRSLLDEMDGCATAGVSASPHIVDALRALVGVPK
jgi:hypothetical protein